MHVEEMLERKGSQIYAVRPECTVREAAAMISSRNIGTALVTDADGVLNGILSERDLVRALGEHGGENLLELPVSQLMTRSVITCTPQTTVSEALSLMASHRIRHLPVMRDKKVLGLISIRDLLEFRLEGLEENFAALIHAKRESARAQKAATVSNRAKSEFFDSLSHELTKPLTKIIEDCKDLAHELSAERRDDDVLLALRQIEDTGRYLMKILETLTELCRIETDKSEPNSEPLQVSELLSSCVSLVAQAAGRTGVAVQVEPDPALPRLSADPSMLREMLLQLLGNAIKFTPSGGTVSVGCSADREGTLRITVNDTGIGIAPENLAKVIDPFYRVESSITRRSEGAGLGLALVDAMVRAHGGMLHLDSKLGIGTTARLCFPPERTVVFPEQAKRHSVAA